MRSILSLLALVLLTLAWPGRSTAWAAVTLDQTYTVAPNAFGDIDASASFEQTYTAGLTGTLDHVTVYLTNVDLMKSTPPLTVEIDNSRGAFLASATISPQGLPNWNASPGGSGCAPVDVYMSAPVQQTAGKRYAIALSSNSSGTGGTPIYGWCGTQAAGYSGGSVYISRPPGSRWARNRALRSLDFSTYVGT